MLRTAQRYIKNLLKDSIELYSSRNHCLYLGNGEILTRTKWGGYIVVPSYNIDVAVGIIRDGIIEPWTTRLVQELLKEGQTYVNVGSNFGYYTSLGGRIVGSKGKVFSYEANPYVFPFLMKTIYYSGIPNIVTAFLRAALDKSNDTIDFDFDFQYIGGGHVDFSDKNKNICNIDTSLFWEHDSIPLLLDKNGMWVKGKGLLKTTKVKTVTLDDTIKNENIDLIQCDAESSEPLIIIGSKKIISRSPNCKIIFEWSDYSFENGSSDYKDSSREMWSFLCNCDFNIRRLIPKINSDGSIRLTKPLSFDEFIKSPHGDYLAIKKKNDLWSNLL